MEVQLTSDQRAFARRAVEAGRLESEEARCGKLLLCGKSVSGGASSFAQPSMKRALPWRVVKAA